MLRDGTDSSKSLALCETNFFRVYEDEQRSVISDTTSNSRVLDSGIDLMTSKEFPKGNLQIHNNIYYNFYTNNTHFSELDKRIINELAEILDSPNKEWEKLADSLDLLLSMRSVLDKQQSPTTYLLSNIDVND